MSAVVIIVSAQPDMLGVCRAGLLRYAPWLRRVIVATSPEVRRSAEISNEECLCLPTAGQGAADHAAGIEYARSAGVARGANLVILLDDDTMILSPRWWPWVETAFAVSPRLGILGGGRSRGLIGQAYVEGTLLVHASMMALRAPLFERVSSFHAREDAGYAYVRVDTGGVACLEAVRWGYEVRPTPFHEPGRGPLYGISCLPPAHGPVQGPPRRTIPIADATEYYEVGDPIGTLWAHLGRGTSFAPEGWWRELRRRAAAHVFGSSRAAKILRRQGQRERFMARSWELVTDREEAAE